eukprot:COSAG06_NODE_8583_length_2124_cov_2647.899704_5_plen_81_part_01
MGNVFVCLQEIKGLRFDRVLDLLREAERPLTLQFAVLRGIVGSSGAAAAAAAAAAAEKTMTGSPPPTTSGHSFLDGGSAQK